MRLAGRNHGLIGLSLALLVWHSAPQFDPARRKASPRRGRRPLHRAYGGHGFWHCSPQPVPGLRSPVPIANLPKDLEGLRIVQITDIHLSPFLSEREFAAAIDMANETRANIALVTGDLITRPGDPLDACLRQLARLRADAGVLGCLGQS